MNTGGILRRRKAVRLLLSRFRQSKRRSPVMKNSLALLILLLWPAHLIRAEPDFHYLGFNGKETLMLDPTRVTTVQYPIAAGPGAGTRSQKAYKEAWIMFINEGQIAKQALWVFDCTGRAGELAASVLLQNSSDKSYDLTAYAQGIGVERYLRRIRPMTAFEAAQRIVCEATR